MSAAEASADNESADEEDREEYAWLQMSPTTRIAGTVRDIIYAGELGENVAQNEDSFGIILDGVEPVTGSLFVNESRDGGLTESTDSHGRPTDYRVVDEDDEDSTIVKGSFVSGENGPNTYDPTDGVTEDTILAWFNGMSGQRIGRTLDTNGVPFAKWTDSGYLVKGLYQAPEEWSGANGSRRKELADNGKAPRVARAPVIREDVVDTEVLIDLSRYQGGRGYEVHVFDAEAFEGEFGGTRTTPIDDIGRTGQYNDLDTDAEITMRFNEDVDDVLAEEEIRTHMYTGEGWQSEPPNAQDPIVKSFDTSLDVDDDADEDDLALLADQAAVALENNDLTPEEGYRGGVEGLLDRNGFPTDEETVEQLTTMLRERADHLEA